MKKTAFRHFYRQGRYDVHITFLEKVFLLRVLADFQHVDRFDGLLLLDDRLFGLHGRFLVLRPVRLLFRRSRASLRPRRALSPLRPRAAFRLGAALRSRRALRAFAARRALLLLFRRVRLGRLWRAALGVFRRLLRVLRRRVLLRARLALVLTGALAVVDLVFAQLKRSRRRRCARAPSPRAR